MRSFQTLKKITPSQLFTGSKHILSILALILVISCGGDDDNPNFTTNPFGNNGFGFNQGFPGQGGLFNGPIINDQFSVQITQALQAIQCPLGRLALTFASGPNGQANRIFGPFLQGGTPSGQTSSAYIGGNQANGDIMVIRQVSNGFQVTGYHMELHLCIDNILVTPQRLLTDFQLRNNQPIILDSDARCAIGDIDFAPAQLTAQAGGFFSTPAPVFISIAPLGLNFCGF